MILNPFRLTIMPGAVSAAHFRYDSLCDDFHVPLLSEPVSQSSETRLHHYIL